MDAELLQRVLNLAEKTGDRVIVVNPESNGAHVVLPLDDYEELVQFEAGLCDLEDWDGDNKRKSDDRDDFDLEPDADAKNEAKIPAPATDEEIERMVQHDLDIIKSAENSQKNDEETAPLDVLDDEAKEEQYYLEPLE